MNIKTFNYNNLIKVVIGTVVAIGLCTLAFSGLTNSVKAAVVNKSEVIPTTYSATASDVKKSDVPKGYVKADYKVKLTESANKSTTKDISAEAAAELGVQDLWRLFGVDISGKTIEMTYHAVSSTQLRAQWLGMITVDKNLSYWFLVDAITGEHQTTGQNKYWSGDINVGFDSSLEKNPEKYTSLAKEVAEKYQLVPGKVLSAEYDGQGYIGNNDGSAKNPQIDLMVTSDKGQQAQLTFSRYNQEFLQVSYDRCVKDMKVFEEQCRKKALEESKNRMKAFDESKNKEDVTILHTDKDVEQITVKTGSRQVSGQQGSGGVSFSEQLP